MQRFSDQPQCSPERFGGNPALLHPLLQACKEECTEVFG